MPEPEPPGVVDERARLALEALRHDPGHEVERPLWLDRIRSAAEVRWPILSERPALGVAMGVALVAALLVAAVWITSSGGGSSGGLPAGFSLPFTTPVESSSTASAESDPDTSTAALVVHAAGAVGTPGVHRVPNGARVADVLDAAGGATADADLDRVNLAAPVADGQRLYVPRIGEAAVPTPIGPADGAPGAGGGAGDATAASAGPVDLNRATEAELDVLPGVGPATAAAIVAHRSTSGPFSRVDDLLEVRGIGPAKLEALRDLVAVG